MQQSSQSAGRPLTAARQCKLDPAEPACHCAEDAGGEPVEALPRALLAPELVAMRRQNLKLDASGSEVRAR